MMSIGRTIKYGMGVLAAAGLMTLGLNSCKGDKAKEPTPVELAQKAVDEARAKYTQDSIDYENFKGDSIIAKQRLYEIRNLTREYYNLKPLSYEEFDADLQQLKKRDIDIALGNLSDIDAKIIATPFNIIDERSHILITQYEKEEQAKEQANTELLGEKLAEAYSDYDKASGLDYAVSKIKLKQAENNFEKTKIEEQHKIEEEKRLAEEKADRRQKEIADSIRQDSIDKVNKQKQAEIELKKAKEQARKDSIIKIVKNI